MNIPFLSRPQSPAQFNVAGVPLRERNGPVFYAGNYVDKGIPLVTDADLYAIAKASTDAVAFNSEHGHSLFDGLLGHASNFRVDRDAQGRLAVFATWHEPEPLAQLLGDTPRTPSIELDWASRKITGIALAKYPRITDAAFFSALKGAYAAFSAKQPVTPLANFAFHTPGEQNLLDPSDCGDPTNRLFPARTEEELRQSIEQLWSATNPTEVRDNLVAIAQRKGFRTVETYWWPEPRAGVSAPMPVPPSPEYYPYFSVSGQNVAVSSALSYNNIAIQGDAPVEAHMNPVFNPQIGQWVNLQTGQPVAAPVQVGGAQVPMFSTGGAQVPTHQQMMIPMPQMQFSQPPAQAPADNRTFIQKLFGLAAEATPAEQQQLQAVFSQQQHPAQHQQVPTPSFAVHPQLQQSHFSSQAQSEATRLFTENRILPTQIQSVAAEFSRAMEDDAMRPALVQFSATNGAGQTVQVPVSRVDALKQHYAALAPHNLTNEQVPEFPTESVALFSREATQLVNGKNTDGVDAAFVAQMTGQQIPSPSSHEVKR
jgi:hypothetical protein